MVAVPVGEPAGAERQRDRRRREEAEENADGPGPFGAKGCGEGAFAGIIAAIATAVADAGVPMTELPLTPERVWRAIAMQDNPTGQEAT